MKIAIVHDYLIQYGGAEKVVEALHGMYPEAPIYTSAYLPGRLPASFRAMDIHTSFIQSLPFLETSFKKYLVLYPMAFESFNLEGYDVVVSSSSGFAKGVRTGPATLHICYCYSPARFLWDYDRYIEKEPLAGITKFILSMVIRPLRNRDMQSSKGVRHFIAISNNIREKIKRIYRRPSDVIYPPVSVSGLTVSTCKEDYFLVVSRLVAYKRIDLVIEAFNRLRKPLRIVGDGPYRSALEKMAGSNVAFLGSMDQESLWESYRHCRAVIFPGDEDFGIVPVEAQAFGRPVIAYASGGALETVRDGVTGVFFKQATAEALVSAVERFEGLESSFDPAEIRRNALRFDKTVFEAELKRFIDTKYAEFQKKGKP
ncbi:MAG: glycosyltransferase [Candidatus Omnitrophota bacterium]